MNLANRAKMKKLMEYLYSTGPYTAQSDHVVSTLYQLFLLPVGL